MIILLIVLGGIVTSLKKHNGQNNGSELKLRVTFPSTRAALTYDPVHIHLDYEYIFLENIYSPLVEFDTHGVLRPGVAEKVEQEGNRLVLTIRDLKTENGTPITASDAAFSLKRLLVLTGNTHGNFRDLVCPGATLKSVEDNCSGIQVQGDKLILTAVHKSPFLLPMLAAIDFAVIPRASVDPKTLKIINMKETSGPYYVASDDGKGHIVLKLNPNHYHAARDIAHQIDFVPIPKNESSLQMLVDNKVDHVTTIDPSRSDAVLEFAKTHPEFNYHTTEKIRLLFLKFTDRGLNHLTADERRLIGEKVREVFHSLYKRVAGAEPRDVFIPGSGDGALDTAQVAKLSKINQQIAKTIPDGISIGLLKFSNIGEWLMPLKKVLPTVNFFQVTDVPTLERHDTQMPDAYIGGTDTGFMEDIGLISYALNSGTFGLTKPERQKWLAKYMTTDSKPERMKMLRDIQFKALTSAAMVPLIASPYTAITRKPWTMQLSNLYADDQLWLIKHQ